MQRASTRVEITVRRNVNAPVFLEDEYPKTIAENYPVGETVITVAAQDADGVSIDRYIL